MALSKTVEIGGVPLSYHRVDSVQATTNVSNLVAVASYVSAQKRDEERSAGGEPIDVYVGASIYEAPYDDAMTVAGAYEWLKANVAAFEGASDVFEDGQPEGGEA